MRYRIHWLDCGCAWMRVRSDYNQRTRVRTCSKHKKPSVQVPSTLTADVHVAAECDHSHAIKSEVPSPTTSRRDRLPSTMSKQIYDEFKGMKFKTLDVTRVFGQLAGEVMKDLRLLGFVRYTQPCGKGTHFVHYFPEYCDKHGYTYHDRSGYCSSCRRQREITS